MSARCAISGLTGEGLDDAVGRDRGAPRTLGLHRGARDAALRAAARVDVVAHRRPPRAGLPREPPRCGAACAVEADVLAGRMTPPVAADELIAAFAKASTNKNTVSGFARSLVSVQGSRQYLS